MTLIKTYAPNNQAQIVCPVFNAETRIADCFALEQKLARGDVQPERRGCQACLRALKCPIYWINRDIRATGDDPYHANEARTLSLKEKHVEAIRAIIVRGETMDQLQVPDDERQAILAANEAATSGKRTRKSPGVTLEAVSRDEEAPRKRAPKAAEPDDVTSAAMSGDMSAAITKASQKAPEAKPVSAPAVAAPEKPKPLPAAAKPAPAPKVEAPAPGGKPMSLLELARQRAAQKAA